MIENAKKFLEELGTNQRALDLLRMAAIDNSIEDSLVLAILSQTARETGYDVTDDEMKQFLDSAQKQQAAASDAAAGQILELDVEDLDAVAGGRTYSRCMDTYQDDENCLWSDNCKKIVNLYVTSGSGTLCNDYAFCSSFAIKPDCEYGRLGF